MYYPFLRGKQFEFLALRELCQELSTTQIEKVIPIIEPVKRSFKDASVAFESMKSAGLRFAAILNPSNGDFQDEASNLFRDEIRSALPPEENTWFPSFILQGDPFMVVPNLRWAIETFEFHRVLLILPLNEDVDNWLDILSMDQVHTIVNCNADSKSTSRKITKYNKNLVRLDDCFQQEIRNKDFRGKEDQFFNDNHVYYREEGMTGFGDYVTMPGTFADGGMLPYVVAIHLTYNKSDDEVWIHHFLSVSNEKGSENIQKKFKEAAVKVLPFFKTNYSADLTRAVNKLQKYVSDGHYPGLGTLKRLSIEHHITLMCRREEKR